MNSRWLKKKRAKKSYTDMNGKTVYLVMTADDSRKEAMNAT